MKATVELPDELYRRVKAKSALEGRSVREVTEMLFRGWVEGQPTAPISAPTAYELLKDGCGIVDSGIGDRASNPAHLDDFGRD